MLRKKSIFLPLAIASLAATGLGSFNAPASAADDAAVRRENIHRCLLDIYQKQRKFAEAGVEYNALLAAKATDPNLRYQYGLFLAQQTKYGPATIQLRKATQLDPTNGDYYGALGKILIQMKDFSGAQGALQRAIQLGRDEYRKDYDSIKQYLDHLQKQKQYQIEMKKYNEQKKKVTPQSSSDDEDE